MSSWRMGHWDKLYGNALEEKRMMEAVMKNYTDEEIAELADWAERMERETMLPDAKKAYGAMRQGADWLIRFRIKEKAQQREAIGKVDNTKAATKQ